ncbi:MAG: zinc ribbon domain-containing protein [Candidatus Fermentibacteria bacterium]
MNCPKCGLEQNDENEECLRCGLFFSRYKPLDYDHLLNRQPSFGAADRSKLKRVTDYMFHTKDKIEIFYFAGRLIAFLFLFIWSIKFFQSSIESNYVGNSFMHLVNLPFHETGHIVFRPLGRIMHSLGGSLGQVIMPFICTLVLLIKTRDTFGASIGLWWMGESVLDLSPYIDDARTLTLQLLGGNTGLSSPYGFHDWNYVLSELNLLKHDHLIADMAALGGKLIMFISLIWGSVLLVRQFNRIRKQSE